MHKYLLRLMTTLCSISDSTRFMCYVLGNQWYIGNRSM